MIPKQHSSGEKQEGKEDSGEKQKEPFASAGVSLDDMLQHNDFAAGFARIACIDLDILF